MTALQQQGAAAKAATYVLATAGTAKKNAALAAIADILTARQEEWLAANAADVAAADYSVGQILRLTEGSLAPVTCLESEENPCPRAGQCTTLPMWEKLDALINDYLDSVSLSDLLAQTDGQRI